MQTSVPRVERRLALGLSALTLLSTIGADLARAEIPEDAGRLIRDEYFEEALDVLERRLEDVDEDDRDERFRTLSWMTLVAVRQALDGLGADLSPTSAFGATREEKEQESGDEAPEPRPSSDRYGLGSLGLEGIEDWQAFEPLNGLVCMALTPEARLELMEELYDAEEDELECPRWITKQGVEVTEKAREFLGAALLAVSATQWDLASRYPRHYAIPSEQYRRATSLQAFALNVLEEKANDWAKHEDGGRDEVKRKSIYHDLGKKLICRPPPELEAMVAAMSDVAAEESSEQAEKKKARPSDFTRLIGRLASQGRRVGTVQYTEAERGNTFSSYAMLTKGTFDAFSEVLRAREKLHEDNMKLDRSMGLFTSCVSTRLTADLIEYFNLRITSEPLESGKLLEDAAQVQSALVTGAAVLDPLQALTSTLFGGEGSMTQQTLLQMSGGIPATKGAIAAYEGRFEDAVAHFDEGYATFLKISPALIATEKEDGPTLPMRTALMVGEYLPFYTRSVREAGASRTTLDAALAQLEQWNEQVLTGYAAEVERLKQKAGTVRIVEGIRAAGGFAREFNDTFEKATEPLRKVQATVGKFERIAGRAGGRGPAKKMPGPFGGGFGGLGGIGKMFGGGGGPNPESRPLPEISEEVDEMMTAAEALEDLKPTSVEKIRKLDNEIRKLQLRLAHGYLELDALETAERYLDELKPFGKKRDYNAFVGPIVSYEHYLRARLAERRGQVTRAKKRYDLAVDYFYFSPQTRWKVFAHRTALLEEAARFAYDNGRPYDVLRYAELARGVMADSPSLFHFLAEPALKKMQARLTEGVLKLRGDALMRATAKGEQKEFLRLNERVDEHLAASTRQGESPLSAQYVGLEKIVKWLEQEELRRYVRELEVFVTLWENRAMASHRAKLLTREAQKAVGDFSLPSAEDWGTSAMTSVFANKGRVSQKEPPEIAAVRRQLPADTSFLSLWLTADALFVVAGNKSKLKTDRIELAERGLALLRDDVNLSMKPLREKIYGALVAPYEKLLKERVVVLASGSLARLKVAALGNPTSGRFFGDEHVLRTAPLFQYATRGTENLPDASGARVLAPWDVVKGKVLPGGEREAKMVNDIVHGQLLSSHQVTRDAVDQALPDSRLVHFAGHAVVEQNVPDFSRLIIGGGESATARGYFTHDIKAKELSGLELAVMSACTSGVGPENEGIGFTSLAAAFLSSGTNAVVASLERVDDEQTRILMEQFYARLAEGLPKDVALQKAQQHVRSLDPAERGWSETGWAAFMLSGSPAPVVGLK